MINLSEQYPNKTAGVTPNYPFGQARNVTLPGDRTGTPWDQALVNDLIGFQQAAMKAANMVPSGVPDNANSSQVLNAITAIFSQYFFGVGQTWKDVKSARVLGVTYQNPFPRPITIMVEMQGRDAGVKVTENGFLIENIRQTYDGGAVYAAIFTVAGYASYKVEKASSYNNTLNKWAERT